MITLHTDFQSPGPDGEMIILKYCPYSAEILSEIENIYDAYIVLDKVIDELQLKVGSQVILRCDDEMEVFGTLDYKYITYLGRIGWVAWPDWSTLRYL